MSTYMGEPLCPECHGCPLSDWEHHAPECSVGVALRLAGIEAGFRGEVPLRAVPAPSLDR